jgi:CHAD domain-containing protein
MSQAIISNLFDSVDSDVYIDQLERNIERVNNRLNDYIKDANEENIHDIRTAIRRLEASYRSLPSRKIRRKKTIREFVKFSKDLFSINSEIRDCDIIIDKLSKEGQISHQDIQKSFKRSLLDHRKSKLDEAMSSALKLRMLSVPRLNKINISQKRLKKRFDKVIKRFASRIEENFPLVITNTEKITELHEMRKDCKKLRYLLELLPDKNTKNNRSELEEDDYILKLVEKLEKVQDMLGTIHDYDTTLAFLRRVKGRRNRRVAIQKTIEKITQVRQSKYEQFVEIMKGDLSSGSNNFFICDEYQIDQV